MHGKSIKNMLSRMSVYFQNMYVLLCLESLRCWEQGRERGVELGFGCKGQNKEGVKGWRDRYGNEGSAVRVEIQKMIRKRKHEKSGVNG